MFDVLLTLGGGLLLYLGAEWLVKGSAGLARHLGVPPLLVGLTVVAYGTSAPEAIVTIQGSLGGFGALAAGNIVGSNIANLGLILGLALVLRPAPHEPGLVRREVPVLLGSSALLVAVLADGALARWEGLALLLGALAYSVWMVRSAQAERAASVPDHSAEEGAESAGAPPGTRVARLAILLAVGLVMVVTGGHLLVKGSVGLARALGLSERIIGLTLVAVGTSLPELATSALDGPPRHGRPHPAGGRGLPPAPPPGPRPGLDLPGRLRDLPGLDLRPQMSPGGKPRANRTGRMLGWKRPSARRMVSGSGRTGRSGWPSSCSGRSWARLPAQSTRP